jgi:hypothetical protein
MTSSATKQSRATPQTGLLRANLALAMTSRSRDAPFTSRPAMAGRGDRAFARWEGRQRRRDANRRSIRSISCHTPPPPHFVRSPSPVFTGEDEHHRSRGAPLRPSYDKSLTETVTADIAVRRTASFGRLCRCSMPSGCRPMPVEAFAGAASARMTERTKEKDSEAKRRQTQVVFCRAIDAHGRAWIARRTSIGVPPRFSSQGVFHRKGLSLRPGFLGRGGQ